MNQRVKLLAITPCVLNRLKEIPSILIGRLAVNEDYKGQVFGVLTLADALKRVANISKDTGISIVVVDALNSIKQLNFMKSMDFKYFDDNP